MHRIRIGTFNVNGKLPSDDLDLISWVTGRPTISASDLSKALPPLPDISPFTVPAIDPLAAHGDIAPPASTIVPLAEPANIPLPTSPSFASDSVTNDGVPDILVFGFQELDLSTAALIYATQTSREDAWARAIMSSLKDVGPYVKVNCVLYNVQNANSLCLYSSIFIGSI
jgi:inositol polyphosphate 5-phosphatase INPP5B/F